MHVFTMNQNSVLVWQWFLPVTDFGNNEHAPPVGSSIEDNIKRGKV
jgi:hypothetical protein